MLAQVQIHLVILQQFLFKARRKGNFLPFAGKDFFVESSAKSSKK